MLVRRAAWERVGPFDEGFVHYCEEVDWCMRAKRAGWSVSLVPGAVVSHRGGASAAAVPGASVERLYASRKRLHAKHRGRLFQLAAHGITHLGLNQERRRLRRNLAANDQDAAAGDRLAAIDRTLHHGRA